MQESSGLKPEWFEEIKLFLIRTEIGSNETGQ